MEESLLQKHEEESEEKRVTWSGFSEEMRRISVIAGPMVAVVFSQYLLQIVATMIVGHLGELYLSSAALAISLAGVSGFSLLVSSYHFLLPLSFIILIRSKYHFAYFISYYVGLYKHYGWYQTHTNNFFMNKNMLVVFVAVKLTYVVVFLMIQLGTWVLTFLMGTIVLERNMIVQPKRK